MTARGPPRASAATTAPKIGMKRAAVDGPKTFPTSVTAAIPLTRSVPAARTRSPTPRLDHSTNRSKVRRTRNACGTGSTPHSGGLRRRTMGRPKPPRIYRVRERPATGLFLGLRELLVRMFERRDEREFSPREEIDEGSASGAHVIDPVRQPELFDRGDGVTAPDDREAVRLRDRGEELAGAD